MKKLKVVAELMFALAALLKAAAMLVALLP